MGYLCERKDEELLRQKKNCFFQLYFIQYKIVMQFIFTALIFLTNKNTIFGIKSFSTPS